MRSMRLKNREIKDQETLRELIDDCVVVRIGAMDKEGMFIVPVNYGYEWEDIKDSAPSLMLYFHSASQGRKADAFSSEPVVALELDREGGVIRGTYLFLFFCLSERHGNREDSETDRSR